MKKRLTEASPSCCLFPDKLLCPVVSLFNITYTDMCEFSTQNIGAVSITIHPAIHYLFRSTLAFGNVFTSCTICNIVLLHHVERRSICRAVMRKVIVCAHVTGFFASYFT